MSTYSEYDSRSRGERIAELENQAAARERAFLQAQALLERELADLYLRATAAPEPGRGTPRHYPGKPAEQRATASGRREDKTRSAREPGSGTSGAANASPEGRTEALMRNGRPSAYPEAASRRRKAGLGAVIITALIAVPAIVMSRGGPSWPPSVAVVRAEAAQACQNPNVASEPTQVNFACAKPTRQILWVFALLTSGDNPRYADAATGRIGLEPITPAQGGDVAWSLNLHHPYDPSDPLDSLTVAARAINNIIGGVTLTGPGGRPSVQPGLESSPGNCARYTGSAAVISRQGYPRVCARPVTGLEHQGALVADVFRRWVVGAPPSQARAAAVLFEHAQDPGNPQVQAIRKTLLPSPSPAGS